MHLDNTIAWIGCEARAEIKACTDLVFNDLGHALANGAKQLHRRAAHTIPSSPTSFLQTQVVAQIGEADGLPMQVKGFRQVSHSGLMAHW